MPKTIVLRECQINELVLGNKNVYQQSKENAEEEVDDSDHQRSIEDVEYEEISAYCRYIDKEAILNAGVRTPMEVQTMLEEASRQDAPTFAEFLRKQEKNGYINFHGDNKRTIFKNLRADLPMMRKYSESNFYAAF